MFNDAPQTPRPVGGWLVVLCGWLALWQPLNLAGAAAEALSALPVRGWALGLLLAARLVITAIGLAAAGAIWERRPGALALTRAAILLSGAGQLFVYATSIAPNNRVPGDTPLYAGATAFVHAGWMLYLARSQRVRSTFQQASDPPHATR